MKVICAGMSKTGTKSMNAALTKLGYNVYDFPEHLEYLFQEWWSISRNEGGRELLKRMFEGVDAVCDMPAYCFWKELMEAFPNAKVVLTVRDSDADFSRSMKNQVESMASKTAFLPRLVSPTYRRFLQWYQDAAKQVFPSVDEHGIQASMMNDMIMRQAYRRHNAYVKQCCPKDKLLVFNCKEGWGPLCKFLGVDIPNEPFPHRNKKGEITKTLMQGETVQQIKKEIALFLLIVLLMIFTLALYIMYYRMVVSEDT